jgi:hypothetical protein
MKKIAKNQHCLYISNLLTFKKLHFAKHKVNKEKILIVRLLFHKKS